MREFTAKDYIQLWIDAEEGSASFPPHSVYQYVTSQYLQTGKTNAALYCSNRILEELHGWKFDLDNLVWDVPTFIERRRLMRRWDIEIPDEMQRNAGNRSWQTQDNAIVGEELETGSFEHKHMMMTMPSKHRIDKLIADVCTSQMVVDKTDAHNQISYVSIYSLERGQLDRNAKERTPALGQMTIGKCPPELWTPYLVRKKEYFDKRRSENLDKAKAIQTEAREVKSQITEDMIESLLINEQPKNTRRSGSDEFNATEVRAWLKEKGYGQVPLTRVQQAVASANRHQRLSKDIEIAEKS